jgi:hypothetical protein
MASFYRVARAAQADRPDRAGLIDFNARPLARCLDEIMPGENF